MNASEKWTGIWTNEYGSRLHITDDTGGRIEGTFTTALGDSAFAGSTFPIIGLSKGKGLHFAFATTDEPSTIASFTGLLRGDALHMAWHVVSDRAVKPPNPQAEPTEIELPWAHAVLANTDTFRRQS
ncbi:avidin/streptavidin family protein [Nocardia anaemiae]|uniref:avidin/streptavidin family protein n=1 Tax=Nocardia anaemiae TaxID=263910 RepID=UPI0007A46FA4|nr:avidin/streptavidin family protein [Nocardia anaemiae]